MNNTFKNLLNEQKTPMTRDEFVSQLDSAFKKHFPNGEFMIRGGAIGGDDTIFFDGMIGGYTVTRHNDNLSFRGSLHDCCVDGIMNDRIQLEWSGASISLKPQPDSYYAMDNVKIGLRKITNTPEKVIASFKKAVQKAAKLVIENKENLYQVEKTDAKYLEIKA